MTLPATNRVAPMVITMGVMPPAAVARSASDSSPSDGGCGSPGWGFGHRNDLLARLRSVSGYKGRSRNRAVHGCRRNGGPISCRVATSPLRRRSGADRPSRGPWPASRGDPVCQHAAGGCNSDGHEDRASDRSAAAVDALQAGIRHFALGRCPEGSVIVVVDALGQSKRDRHGDHHSGRGEE